MYLNKHTRLQQLQTLYVKCDMDQCDMDQCASFREKDTEQFDCLNNVYKYDRLKAMLLFEGSIEKPSNDATNDVYYLNQISARGLGPYNELGDTFNKMRDNILVRLYNSVKKLDNVPRNNPRDRTRELRNQIRAKYYHIVEYNSQLSTYNEKFIHGGGWTRSSTIDPITHEIKHDDTYFKRPTGLAPHAMPTKNYRKSEIYFIDEIHQPSRVDSFKLNQANKRPCTDPVDVKISYKKCSR